jgi:hypothetical protein
MLKVFFLKFKKSFTLLAISSLFTSISSFAQVKTTLSGTYLAEIKTEGGPLPFFVKIQKDKTNQWQAWAINGQEQLPLDPPTLNGDSLEIGISVFEAKLVFNTKTTPMKGYWYRQASKTKSVQSPLVLYPNNWPKNTLLPLPIRREKPAKL